ncbi:hypothetical protein ALP12_102260 [Pseudomonas savastanoi pv. phaseolicola]|nr:hypothetical protein ALP12_102260 [Pseudomonas savastanoi pv. phaseolicola]
MPVRLDHITPKQFESNDQIAVTVKMTRTESLRHKRTELSHTRFAEARRKARLGTRIS